MLVKDELLDKVVARVREQMPEEQASQVEEFVRQYYGWVDTDDLEDRSPIDAYGAAVSHWNFASRREPGERKIRIYNPVFEEHGWQSTHTVVEMVNDDMPFLVDSTRMEINHQDYGIHLILHPVMKVRRDPEDRQTEPEVLERLREGIENVLGDVRAAVEDWARMREKARDIASGLQEEAPPVEESAILEARAFLEWIADDNFTFLGYRDYELLSQNGEDQLCSVSGSGLGILRETNPQPASQSFAKLP